MTTLAGSTPVGIEFTAPVLAVDDVWKVFTTRRREVTALRGLSLQISAGEFVAVVGRSGCGKSTLLRLLSGLLPPSAGEIRLAGQPVDGPPRQARCVFQDFAQSLLPWKTVAGNVRFGLRHAYEPSTGSHEELVAHYLDLVGLGHAADRYPWELSGGMQQRAAIARALAARPQLLLMDEAFSGVDALSRANLQDVILHAWAEAGLTVVFVTHDIDEAVYLADRVVVLHPEGHGMLADLRTDLPRPRRQLTTRELPEFLHYRRELLQLVLD
ncbi:MAG: NitT/TauT family transport system ATP-binding protein [Gemmatimonadales bacterium]|jgi:NitT/TauT family transport system ATP-binding protein|nr:NitT/TauT family transport system ATP-binding protein [Gemmatimonadales bacterium]